MKNIVIFLVGIVLGVGGTFAPQVIQHAGQSNQPYAGQQTRMISSLSTDDIAQLRDGKGWGLAKPAELNGYPGPAHILELAEPLNLSGEQLSAVKASFDRMRVKASSLGKALIEAEQALDQAFIDKKATPEEISRRLADAERVRAQLRQVHLSAHLEVTPLLSTEQKEKYTELRGYGTGGHSGHGNH